MQKHLKEIIRILWLKRLPFVAYRLPCEQEMKILVQLSATVELFNIYDIETVSGFVMAPFECVQTKKAYILKPDLTFNSSTGFSEVEKLPSLSNQKESNMLSNHIWSKEIYLQKAHEAIKELKKNKMQKLVLSRIVEKELKGPFKPDAAFALLNERYEHSFNYICHLPAIGSWIGATPETFLRIHNSVTEIVSLAGTKPVDNINWTLKERREQAIVTDFISHELNKLGIVDYQIEGPETVIAGNVAHLSSKFTMASNSLKGKASKLISSLHPTPAVCGLPKIEAFKKILQLEDQNRKFYTGFLGPWKIDGQSDLFVNLRCAEFNNSKLHIFVGGGLTSSSKAESEWEETIHKSRTLLSVTENF